MRLLFIAILTVITIGAASAQWIYQERERSAFSSEVVHLMMTLKQGRMLGIHCVGGASKLMYILAEKIDHVDTVNVLKPKLLVRVDKNHVHELPAVARNINGKFILTSGLDSALIAEIRDAKRKVSIVVDIAGNKFVETRYSARGSTKAANTLLRKCTSGD